MPTRQIEIVDEHGAYAIFGDMKYFEGMDGRSTPMPLPIGPLIAGKDEQELLLTEKEEPKKLTAKIDEKQQQEMEEIPQQSEVLVQEEPQKIL